MAPRTSGLRWVKPGLFPVSVGGFLSATDVPPQKTDNNNLETLSRVGTEKFAASPCPPLCTCSSDTPCGTLQKEAKKDSFHFFGGGAGRQEERGV